MKKFSQRSLWKVYLQSGRKSKLARKKGELAFKLCEKVRFCSCSWAPKAKDKMSQSMCCFATCLAVSRCCQKRNEGDYFLWIWMKDMYSNDVYDITSYKNVFVCVPYDDVDKHFDTRVSNTPPKLRAFRALWQWRFSDSLWEHITHSSVSKAISMRQRLRVSKLRSFSWGFRYCHWRRLLFRRSVRSMMDLRYLVITSKFNFCFWRRRYSKNDVCFSIWWLFFSVYPRCIRARFQ